MNVKEYIKNNILIFDGAMGSYLMNKSKTPQEKCELCNITESDLIFEIHKEYIDAGAKAIKTNTFAANSQGLGSDKALVKNVIKSGYDIAASAAKDKAFVFADMGPVEEDGSIDIISEYKFIADCFIALGAENFLFETLNSSAGIKETARYIKSKVKDAFIIVSFAIQPDGYTRDGHLGISLFDEISKVSEIDAVGLNCISGPYHILQYIKELSLKDITLSVMPNAGYPTVLNNRTFFNPSPEYFSEKMADIVKQGAKIIGGCCGTTPEYIRLTVKEFENIKEPLTAEKTELKQKPSIRKERENSFLTKLMSGERVIAVELDPPADADIEKFIENAKKIKQSGADIITIADCPVGRARMDSTILACKIKREVGIDALPHITCRDRNINATKALLLGMCIENIDNVLIVTGDPIPSAQRNEVKSVFNFNSRMLARFVSNLNETTLPSPLNICGALNINAVNFDIQLKLAKEKIENGMAVFLTQPVLTQTALENLKRARQELSVKILGGIMPVVSYRNACFMNSEISGINVGEDIIALYENKTPEQSKDLAVKISLDFAEKMMPYVDGLYIITPFSRADIICEILEGVKE